MLRMEGDGHRVMAAAFRPLDPATFDPAGDLLGHVTSLEMTSLVAMVDPPRDESKAAVRDAQNTPTSGCAWSPATTSLNGRPPWVASAKARSHKPKWTRATGS